MPWSKSQDDHPTNGLCLCRLYHLLKRVLGRLLGRDAEFLGSATREGGEPEGADAHRIAGDATLRAVTGDHAHPLGEGERRRAAGRVAPFVFTGIQIVSKRLLRYAPSGAFSTNIFWDRAIAEGRCFGAVHQGLWFDVGSPPAITATEAALVSG